MNFLNLVNVSGAGRTWIVLCENEKKDLAKEVSDRLKDANHKVALLACPQVTADNWLDLTTQLTNMLASLEIRQASFIAFKGAVSVIQNFALHQPKLVRMIMCIDGSSRPHPNWFSRLVDRLEQNLPFGLPLRVASKDFDIRPFAHRLRCPLMLVSSAELSTDVSLLAKTAPTACCTSIKSENVDYLACALLELSAQLQSVPPKCPQKNLSR